MGQSLQRKSWAQHTDTGKSNPRNNQFGTRWVDNVYKVYFHKDGSIMQLGNDTIIVCCCTDYNNSCIADTLILLRFSISLSGVLDFFDRNKILSGYDLSHYQVPHCIRVFFYFVLFVFIHHNFQFYFKLCTYRNILDIYLS